MVRGQQLRLYLRLPGQQRARCARRRRCRDRAPAPCRRRERQGPRLRRLPAQTQELEGGTSLHRAHRGLVPADRVGHLTQATDIRYCVTSLNGDPDHLYQKVYCARGQAENLIKLHKAQLASDRTSCHRATANQVRLVLHTAAYWLMHAIKLRLPRTSPLARCEFATLRQRLLKIGARVIEHAARIRVHLPTSCPERTVFAQMAAGFVSNAPS